jgi:hypothetical protein
MREEGKGQESPIRRLRSASGRASGGDGLVALVVPDEGVAGEAGLAGAALDGFSVGARHRAPESDEERLATVRRDDLRVKSGVALGDGLGAAGCVTDTVEGVGNDVPAWLEVG